MKVAAALVGILAAAASVLAQESAAPSFSNGQIKRGEGFFAANCADCHGRHMINPANGVDLNKFPVEDHERFVNVVTYGRNGMPPWGGTLSATQIEDIWAYVATRGTTK